LPTAQFDAIVVIVRTSCASDAGFHQGNHVIVFGGSYALVG